MTQEQQQLFSSCYDFSIKKLANQGLLSAKINWMKEARSLVHVESFLRGALEKLGSVEFLHLELVNIYVRQKQWSKALEHLNYANIPVNDITRLKVEYHLGQFSKGSDLSLLPYIYQNKPITHAKVTTNGNLFSLQKISDDASRIHGEPSITSSPDGQNIWLLWTDSGQNVPINGMPFYYWTIQSKQSRDGGNTWSPFSVNTLPGQADRFHFDPMTIYDDVNNIIYAGGMVKGFSSTGGATTDDGMFFYRWELNNDINFGPFKTFLASPDKGWMATDSHGNLTNVHRYGIDVSTDKAENFIRATNHSFTSGQPRYNQDDCLIITDLFQVVSCHNGGQIINPHVFSSSLIVSDDIPGTFRVFAFAQNIIQSNGDIYVVYTDYKFVNSPDLTIYMTKSTDDGVTWSAPWIISKNIAGDQFAPWIEVDSRGGMHMLFFDTRNGTQTDTASDATLDVFYQYSSDLGQSWQETRVTPTSLTTPNLIWGDYFLTDYISMSVTNNDVYLAFPWSNQAGHMDMYFAKKLYNSSNIIFTNGFEPL